MPPKEMSQKQHQILCILWVLMIPRRIKPDEVGWVIDQLGVEQFDLKVSRARPPSLMRIFVESKFRYILGDARLLGQ